MYFLAVFVGDDVSCGGAGVCPQDDAILEDDPANRGPGFRGLGWGKSLLEQERVPFAVLERETGIGSLKTHHGGHDDEDYSKLDDDRRDLDRFVSLSY